MKRVVLCSDCLKGIASNVNARIEEGRLEIEGQNLGVGVLSGGSEYEYFYSFNVGETKKFATLLTGGAGDMDVFLDALVEKFGGTMWYFTFFDYVREHNLRYAAFSC